MCQLVQLRAQSCDGRAAFLRRFFGWQQPDIQHVDATSGGAAIPAHNNFNDPISQRQQRGR